MSEPPPPHVREKVSGKGLRVKRERRRRKSVEPNEKSLAGKRSALFWGTSVVGALVAAFAVYFLVVYPAGPGRGRAKTWS